MHTNTNLVPECMVYLGHNSYQCQTYGWIIQIDKLPINCNGCGKDTAQPSLAAVNEFIEPIKDLPENGPSLLRKAANYAKDTTQHVKGGMRRVDPPEYERRINICNDCEMLDGGHCRICGCPVSQKAWRATSHCPMIITKCEDCGWELHANHNVDECGSCKSINLSRRNKWQ